MIARSVSKQLQELYEKDETAWLDRSAGLIQEGRIRDLDRRNLAQHLIDMAVRDRREVFSRLRTLLAHQLKWDYQPGRRSASWEKTLLDQKDSLQVLLDRRTLANHAREVFEKAYERALERAVKETNLPRDAFPSNCPYIIEQLLESS